MQIRIEDGDIGKRLDVFLANELETATRSAVQKWIAAELVQVNAAPCKANYKLRGGDSLDVTIPEPEPIDALPENIPLDILYEDNWLIVVNKPKGMVVHPAAGHHSGTLVNALLHHCGDSLSGINGALRPGIVHRIDRDTTGVLVVAKNDEAHASLSAQLAAHSITRRYEALVHGRVREGGTVDKALGRHPVERKKMAVLADGRRAVTHYEVLTDCGTYTHIAAQLETGRTHQIRVHMASLGHPLLGDAVYGREKQPFKLDGQTLHAAVLGFQHPKDRRYVEFSAPLPDYFAALLAKLRKM